MRSSKARGLLRASVRARIAAALLALFALGMAQASYGSRAVDAAATLMRRAQISYRQLAIYQQLSIDASDFILAQAESARPRSASGDAAAALTRDFAVLKSLTGLESRMLETQGEDVSPQEQTGVQKIADAIERLIALEGDAARESYEAQLRPLLVAAVEGERAEVARSADAMRDAQARMHWLARLGVGAQAVSLGFVFLLITRSLLDPLSRLVGDIREFGRGDLSHRVEALGRDEFTLLARHINRMAGALDRGRRRLLKLNQSLETIVAERTRLLEQKNRKLLEVDESRRNFLADVSHELRTPLTAIVGEADLALRLASAETKEDHQALSSILANAVFLNRRIDDLMALARSEDGRIALDRRLVELDDVARGAVGEVASLARINEVGVELEALSEPVRVFGDAARLRQCLTVLLDNAVKFSSPSQKVTVALAQEGANARLSVTDCGEGIAPNDLPQVFDRFYQTEAGRRRGGTGLGLAIARRIVEAHGGSIEASSADGGGTRISILLSSAGTAVP